MNRPHHLTLCFLSLRLTTSALLLLAFGMVHVFSPAPASAQSDAQFGEFSETPEDNFSPSTGQVEMRIFDFVYTFDGTNHNYRHKRKFDEVGGLGVTIMRGKVCAEEGRLCVSGLTAYRINENRSLVQNHRVSTKREKDVITIEYWALDDLGNQQYFKATLQTNGEEVRVIY